MSLKLVFVLLALSGLFGIAVGYVLRFLVALGKVGSLELEIKQRLLEAKEDAARITSRAEEEAHKEKESILKEVRAREEAVSAKETRLLKREALLDERQSGIDLDEDEIKRREKSLEHERIDIQKKQEEITKTLERIATLTKEEARAELLMSVEKEYEEALVLRLQKLETQARDAVDAKARELLTTAVHRVGNAVNTDIMSFQFSLPKDDLKGKIIGKDGRNIRAFERATGVDLIVDETPGSVTISSFDPVRRHVARIALEKLLIDGRIQPAKIESAVAKAQKEVEETIVQKGRDAAYEAGVHGLDQKLLVLLGRLHFRTSYGQNILTHSLEMAHIGGMLAAELGADVGVVRAGALLHDIGKAVDHAVEGTHVEIGRRLLQKFNVDTRIIQAMQSHHEEYPYETLESVIVQVADVLSAVRPGARKDTAEHYLKRLGDLETLAKRFDGVDKCYAIEAGRELRIFVNPGKVSDSTMHKLARDIAAKIHRELKYPGEIKVNVIRENRVVEFAR